ncbi:DUF502 domain-containing protein [Legionella erythra]|uniref:Transmembrane protein n=1 Tax=Legionella erythra TaxID=448 RepID=A0A0W0TRY3_LEGER|nr:DUF502 domain-containing protein [Legionella erythra]KTC98187.1 transmembrane protein [Legionella erythra]
MKSKSIRSYLFAGLVVWLPILVTFVVLRFMVDLLDSTIALLPSAYQPERLLGVDIPGFGVIFSLVLLIVTGIIATNILGQRLFGWGEALLAKIPLVRSIYNASKQVIQAIFATNSQAFRKVLLIEYPRKDCWSLAFMTGNPGSQLFANTTEEMVSVFVPTTPNPTSGFLMMVPKKDVIEVGMTIDEALKYIISLGVMPPNVTPDILTHAN